MTTTYLRDLHFLDASKLSDWLGDEAPAEARSKRDGKPAGSRMREYLRDLFSSPGFHGLVWEGSASDGDMVRNSSGDSAGGSVRDEARIKGFLFLEQTSLRQGTLQVEMLLDPLNESLSVQEAEELLELLFQNLGADERVKVVSMHIPERYAALAEVCERLPYANAGARYSLGLSGNGREEAWLRIFTFSKTANWPFTWVFVPTKLGLVGVYGNKTSITYVKWFDYKKFIQDISVREICMAEGYADDFGRMKDYGEIASGVGAAGGGGVGVAVGGVGDLRASSKRQVPDVLLEAARQLEDYIAGRRQYFDLPLQVIGGTPFQRQVWQTIRGIPYGSTASYEEIGTAISAGDMKKGRDLSRSVGAACGANPLVIFVPCHRVIAKDGKLRGYAYGVKRKDYLLSLEVLGLG